MLVMDIPAMQPANGRDPPSLPRTEIPNVQGHRPGFLRRFMAAQRRKMTDQVLDQLRLAIPKAGQQVPFLLGRQQIGGKGGLHGYGIPVYRAPIPTLRLHGRPSRIGQVAATLYQQITPAKRPRASSLTTTGRIIGLIDNFDKRYCQKCPAISLADGKGPTITDFGAYIADSPRPLYLAHSADAGESA